MGWSRRDETKRRGADEIPQDIDITIDGADEVDPSLNLIMGGGAFLREKIVAQAIRWQMIVVDQSKLSPKIGTHWALPVEILRFDWRLQMRFLELLDAEVVPRMRDERPVPYRLGEWERGPASPHLRSDSRDGIKDASG